MPPADLNARQRAYLQAIFDTHRVREWDNRAGCSTKTGC
jgi:hypothetical protein